MCDMCNGMTRAEQLKGIQGSIDEHGVAVYYVEDPDPGKCLGYTVGLTLRNAQEFLVRGLDRQDTHTMLNGFADSVLRLGEHFEHGHTSTWRDGRILHFNRMPGAREIAHVAFTLCGPGTRVLEIHFAQPRMPQGATAIEYRNLTMTLANTRLLPRHPR